MVQLIITTMKTLFNYTFLFLVLILSSCGIARDMVTPKDDIPKNFRDIISADTTSIGQMPIKDFFGNSVITALIDSALVRNYDLQIAGKNIEAAELVLKRARLAQLPQINLQVTASSTLPSDNSLNGLSASQFLQTSHVEDFNANLALSWEADIWGKISRQKDAAYAGYLQTEEVKKLTQTRIVTAVAAGFYRLLMLDAQLAVAKRNMELNTNTVKMIKMQFDAGQTTSLAIQQAEAQQLNAAQLVPQILQQIAAQENAISALAGRFPSAVTRNTTLAQLTVPDSLAIGVPATLLGIRPDVRSMELNLRIANAKVGIANARMYPSLVISATGGLNSFKASNWFNVPASLFGIVGGGITQPIFQGRALKTNFELAKIEREQSVLAFRQTVINAVGEVSTEQTRLLNLKNEYLIVQRKVTTLESAVKNADLLFKSGMANYLEVIAAQGNLLRGELDLTSIKAEQLNASLSLYRALGGGWR